MSLDAHAAFALAILYGVEAAQEDAASKDEAVRELCALVDEVNAALPKLPLPDGWTLRVSTSVRIGVEGHSVDLGLVTPRTPEGRVDDHEPLASVHFAHGGYPVSLVDPLNNVRVVSSQSDARAEFLALLASAPVGAVFARLIRRAVALAEQPQ